MDNGRGFAIVAAGWPPMSAPSRDDGRRDFRIPELPSQHLLKPMSWAGILAIAGRDGGGCHGRVQGKRWEETKPETPWDRRELLKAISAGAATGFLAGGVRDAAAQQVKWSEGTEPPKLKGASQCQRLSSSHL